MYPLSRTLWKVAISDASLGSVQIVNRTNAVRSSEGDIIFSNDSMYIFVYLSDENAVVQKLYMKLNVIHFDTNKRHKVSYIYTE